MAFLEESNQSLLQQLKQAQLEIQQLKEENKELKLLISKDSAMRSTVSDFRSTQTGFQKKGQEETFVTMGSENPQQ